MILHLRVKPNGKTDQLFYDEAGQLIAKIKAPAQDGKANEYLVKFFRPAFLRPFGWWRALRTRTKSWRLMRQRKKSGKGWRR
jgi:uncharacterized protein (TIGR00251 family)